MRKTFSRRKVSLIFIPKINIFYKNNSYARMDLDYILLYIGGEIFIAFLGHLCNDFTLHRSD